MENDKAKSILFFGVKLLKKKTKDFRLFWKKFYYKIKIFGDLFIIVTSVIFLVAVVFLFAKGAGTFLGQLITTTSILLFLQGSIALTLLIFTWNNPLEYFWERKKIDSLPDKVVNSFSIIIPAHQEEEVIGKTIKSISEVDYPEEKKEVFVVVNRKGNKATIKEAKKAIAATKKKNIHLVVFGGPAGKAEGLNIGLKKSTKDFLVIFDAEDRVHPNLFKVVDKIIQKKNVDVVQSGVQLMNFQKDWYSLFNVLEYYFWFKSSLHFFVRGGVVPLGGNTVFFRRKLVEEIGGWDEECLTEDADIGLRLAIKKARMTIVYDEKLATREQTPPTLTSFIKQRTRWNQGFMQIFFKGEWIKLPKLRQKIYILLILLWPFLQAIVFLIIPFIIYAMFVLKLSFWYSMISFLPLYILLFMGIIANLAIYEFTKNYNKKYNPLLIPQIFLMIIPYQMILGISALRAMYRQLFGKLNWEKTEHLQVNDISINDDKK